MKNLKWYHWLLIVGAAYVLYGFATGSITVSKTTPAAPGTPATPAA